MRGHRASYDDALNFLISRGGVVVRNAIQEPDDSMARQHAERIERDGCDLDAELVAHVWRKPVWMVVMDARRLRIKRAA